MKSRGWISERDSFSILLCYNRSLREYTHRWSPSSFGEMFGYREYSEIIPLKEFLTTPMAVVEDILEGVGKGRTDIKKAKDAARSADEKRKEDPASILQRELNKLKG